MPAWGSGGIVLAMSFKIHLIIVSVIIVIVYLTWQLMSVPPAPVVPAAKPKTSTYSISIAHATWGRECAIESNGASDAFRGAASTNPLREDNVLVRVNELCSGRVICEIPLNSAALGEDPAPDCLSKTLEVEYRCFSYDRPWTVTASSGKLVINCDRGDTR